VAKTNHFTYQIYLLSCLHVNSSYVLKSITAPQYCYSRTYGNCPGSHALVGQFGQLSPCTLLQVVLLALANDISVLVFTPEQIHILPATSNSHLVFFAIHFSQLYGLICSRVVQVGSSRRLFFSRVYTTRKEVLALYDLNYRHMASQT